MSPCKDEAASAQWP
uniref:Leukocyte specific transcript 1 n=1 Tax=Microcebus murinus TaxID=30608 RepID=A0A8C5Y776_MICMU